MLAQVGADEVEDLPLALRQVLDEVHLTLLSQPHSMAAVAMGEHMFGEYRPLRTVSSSVLGRTISNRAPLSFPRPPTIIDGPQAAVAELVDAQG